VRMALNNFRKETSERSDDANWAKSLLINESGYYLESIEGCNQNANNVVTHLIERARVDYVEGGQSTEEEIMGQIIDLETADALQRKINFAKCYGLPLSYVLYCDEREVVYLLSFTSLSDVKAEETFYSYKDFADWIAEIKGWKSGKFFREIQDLPNFDKALRKAGTPWPTNIDCFICDKNNAPIAILEFQNAKNTNVASHCNNDFFLCRMTGTNQRGYTVYHDDIRRWTSQEILRVQSNLRYFILTWSQAEHDFILKEVEIITMPHFPEKNGKPDWDYMNAYKRDMNRYVLSNKAKQQEEAISSKYKTYNLDYIPPGMSASINEPPLSIGDKTFPSIYYNSKELVRNSRQELVTKFIKLINHSV
jgi:hypothetical protein